MSGLFRFLLLAGISPLLSSQVAVTKVATPLKEKSIAAEGVSKSLFHTDCPSRSRSAERDDASLERHGRYARQLSQAERSGETKTGNHDEEYPCSLGRRQNQEFLDAATRTWRIDDDVLNEIRNDLQVIINCTDEGDALLFDVRRTVRPSARVTIPWNLTISAVTESTQVADGVYPRASRKTVFTCPREGEGVFLIESKNVLLANLKFENCTFNDSGIFTAIVEVEECRSNSSRDTIQLHHVSFKRNMLIGAAGLSARNSTCSAVELIDFEFEDNACSDTCGVYLAMQNRLQDVTIRRIQRSDAGTAETSVFYSRYRSETFVERMEASENRCPILYLEGGLTMLNSTFAQNALYICESDYPSSSPIVLSNTTGSIERCHFRQNEGRTGGVLAAGWADMAIINSTFEENTAVQGGVVAFQDGHMSIESCSFSSNSVHGSAGVLHAVGSRVIVVNSTLSKNHAHLSGGCFCLEDGNLEVMDSTLTENDARSGGVLSFREGASGNLTDSIFENNRASTSGGLCHVEDSELSILRCSFNKSSAEDGGGIYASESRIYIQETSASNLSAGINGGFVIAKSSHINMKNCSVFNNSAGGSGGALECTRNCTLVDRGSASSNNSARLGGAISLGLNSSGSFTDCRFSSNSASTSGGAAYIQGSQLSIQRGLFDKGSAGRSTGIGASSALMSVIETTATNLAARDSGGFISATENSSIVVEESWMNSGRSSQGGAISLSESDFKARSTNISNCEAEGDGGGIMGIDSSRFLCIDCILRDNNAERGGAVFFEYSEDHSLVVQLENSTVRNNSAIHGGGIEVVPKGALGQLNCSTSQEGCGVVALASTVFSENSARGAGGAIYVDRIAIIKIRCPPMSEPRELEFYTKKEWEAMKIFESIQETCPSWKGNIAERYGDEVASSVSHVRKKILYNEQEEAIPLDEDQYIIQNHKSGTQLPAVAMSAIDDLGQGPAVGVDNRDVNAVMWSPDGFFEGSRNAFLNTSIMNITITGFVLPNVYTVRVDFEGSYLKSFEIAVNVSSCSMGEIRSGNGMFCEPCNAASFSFHPEEDSECQPCPTNGNCKSTTIVPTRGYWHQTPCSVHIQRCLAPDACNAESLESGLPEATRDVHTCHFDEKYMANYTEAQCRAGHKGPLCGSCKASHGRSHSFLCEKCFPDFSSFCLVFLSFLILLGLSSITIRSNLTSIVPSAQPTVTRPSESSVPTRSTSSVPVNEQMVEMWITGHVPEEILNPALNRQIVTDQSSEDAELAKWKAAELFKIIVNFLQVTAIALAVNVDWTLTMIALFEAAEVIGGITSEAFSCSMDCLIPAEGLIERSVARILFDVGQPLAAIFVFAVFWIIITMRHKASRVSLLKRVILSALVVFYISYISLSKSFFNILSCVEVHDSTLVDIDHTSNYWALDTSVKCYAGSHATLAGFLGWPFLLIFTLGFPMAVGYFIIKNVADDYKEGWLYDIAGFLYRSYRKKLIFWESLIMVRKALLVLIVVFSYPLGANLQQVFAVLVLILALYLQMVHRPYRSELDHLNEMESASIFVSTLTFVSSIFFSDDRVSTVVRALVTVAIALINITLFLYLSVLFFMFAATYIRSVLTREGVSYNPNLGSRHILWIYFFHHVLERFMDRLHGLFHRSRPSVHGPFDV